MKVEVAVVGSPSLISLMVSVDVKHHERKRRSLGRLPVPNSPHGLCGRIATLKQNQKMKSLRAQELCVKVEVDVLGSPALTVLMVFQQT